MTQLNWHVRQEIHAQGSEDKTYTVHCAQCPAEDERSACRAIDSSIDKAVELLAVTASDESRYLVFDWDSEQGSLSMVVTDESKQHDADVIVRCSLANWLQAAADKAACADSVKYWIKDYLTTCTGFFNYSLIAVFAQGDRAKTQLL